MRLLWTYLPDREAIAFQNEARHADGIRVVASDGEVIASERVRPAESGEPRTCGGGIRWPIAVLTLPADVIADFRQGSAQGSQTRLATYRVEVAQSDGIWHPVSVDQLLDRAQLAGAPCYEW
ncbi:MAG: hypothetical protein ACRDF0_03225 [Candidatus Limnocylindria bacterium]